MHTAHIGEIGNVKKFWSENLNGRHNAVDIVTDGRTYKWDMDWIYVAQNMCE
jgi:hypothetical protein